MMKKISFKPNKLGILTIIIVVFIVAIIAYKKRKNIKKIAMNTINYLKLKTWDIHSDRRINKLHPLIQAKAKEFIIKAEKELGITLRVSSGFRSWEAQTKLYAQGRTAPGKRVTNAKAGESYHNYGLAIDVVEIKNGKAVWNNPNWDKIGALGERLGFSWGGRWKRPDRPHFAITFGKHHTELAALYKAGQRTGQYVNLT